MKSYVNLFAAVTLLLISVTSCRFPQKSISSYQLNSLPESYITGGDSLRTSPLPLGKDYFKSSVLRQLIDSALTHSFDLKEASARIELARAGVRLQTGLNKPTLETAVSLGQRKFGNYTIDGVGNFDTRFSENLNEKQRIPDPFVPDILLGFQSSWEIDLWGKLRNQKRASIERLLQSEAYKNLVITNLVSEIAAAYYELLVKDGELRFLDENIDLQSKELEIVQVLKQSGQATQLAVDLFYGQLLASQTIRKEVEMEIVVLENKINFLLGRYPQPLQRPFIGIEELYLSPLAAGMPSDLLLNRPDIQWAERALRASKADVEAARLAFFPRLNLAGGLGLQAFRPSVILNPGSVAFHTFGGLLTPLVNRRELEASLMASEAEQKLAYIQYDKTVVKAFSEVFESLKLIENTTQRFDLKSQEVTALRNSIVASGELFKSGRATYLEVVTAQKNALQSQIELTNVRKAQIAASIALYKSLGGGW